MSESRYIVRAKADEDLDEQAFYYATEANPELGHRFLLSAHNTFALLATAPQMGWNPRLRNRDLRALRMFRVTGFARTLILYRPLEHGIEVLRVIHGSRNIHRLLRREGIE